VVRVWEFVGLVFGVFRRLGLGFGVAAGVLVQHAWFSDSMVSTA